MYSSSICPETDVIFLFFWLLFYLFFSGILISVTLKQRTYQLIDLTKKKLFQSFLVQTQTTYLSKSDDALSIGAIGLQQVLLRGKLITIILHCNIDIMVFCYCMAASVIFHKSNI